MARSHFDWPVRRQRPCRRRSIRTSPRQLNAREDDAYFPHHLEATLRKVKERSAREIFKRVKEDVLAFSPPEDDISCVIIKRSRQQGGGLT